MRVLPFRYRICRSSLRVLRRRRASLHTEFGTNRIRGVADQFISKLEITKDRDVAVNTQACNYVHPFGLPITYALYKSALLVVGHGGELAAKRHRGIAPSFKDSNRLSISKFSVFRFLSDDVHVHSGRLAEEAMHG
jgi:hypothetical protein